MLQIETSQPQDGVAVITLSGELDVHTCPELKQTIRELLDQGVANLVVNLNQVGYLDSTGLGVFIGAMRRATERGGSLKLVCEEPRNRRIFEIAGLARVVGLFHSEAEALA